MSANSAPNILASDLESKLQDEYKKVDRTGLELPERQECDTCHQHLEHTCFDLKRRNRHTNTKPYELQKTCRSCKKLGKEIIKGAFVKHISTGSLLLSDAAIDWLTGSNGQNQKAVINALGQLAINQDLDAIKLLIGLCQGKPGTVKVTQPMEPAAPAEKPVKGSSDDDLLAMVSAGQQDSE
jgi:hypothetical protein